MPGQLSVVEYGTGTPLVLLHAFPFSSALLAPLGRALTGSSVPGPPLRVITPDLRGFGASPLGTEAPSLDLMADDVAEWMRAAGISSALLGGVSMGGYVTMAMLRRHPDLVAGVLLLDTKGGADTPEAREVRHAQAEAVLDQGVSVLAGVPAALLGPSTMAGRPDVVAAVERWVAEVDPQAVAWAQRAMAERPDSLPTLAGFGGPATVVVGAEDTLSPESEAVAMAAALGAGEPAVIPDVGHLAVIEDPEAVASAVRAALPGLLAG